MVETNLRARIAALAEAEPSLADDLALRGALIEIVDRAAVSVPEVRLPADLVRARLAAGAPLLDRLDVPVSAAIGALFQSLTVAMLADPAARQPAEAILQATQSHRLHAEQLIREAAVGHTDHLTALAEGVTAPADLVETLADLAARPVLTELARRLRPALGLAAWGQGFCPICGAHPIFADDLTPLTLADDLTPPAPLFHERRGPSATPDPRVGAERGEQGTLRLRCGRCTTAWAWSLPACPACPACQGGRLAAFDALDVPEAGRWTLLGCDGCRAYLKVAATPRGDSLGALLVDDLATWTLDRAALNAGLARPVGLSRRLEHGDDATEELDDD